MSLRLISGCAIVGFLCVALNTRAQPAPATRPVRAPAPPTQPSDTIVDDDAGFEAIFDGKTLTNWDGDPKYWRVENGCLVGEVSPETILKRNTFIIWRGGVTKDFELKVQYRISDRGNSGINYRSAIDDLPTAMKGYQADIDGANRYTGQNYEERGRTFLALRGQATHIAPGEKPKTVAWLGDRDALKAFVKSGEEWNDVHLIVRGNTMAHIVNGHLMSLVIDDDETNRMMEGLLGVQVHVGPPMKIEFRNFRLKKL